MLNVVRSGGGPLVVLMHGVSNSALWWSRLIPILSRDHTVVAIDMLGHGLSDRVPHEDLDRVFEAALEAEREVLAELVAEHGPGSVIAHSMGGAIAAKIAATSPHLIDRLIALDPAWLTPAQTAGYADSAEAMMRTIRWQESPSGALAENMEKRPHWDLRDHITWVYGQQHVDLGVIRAGNVSFSEPWQQIVSAITAHTLVITSNGADCLITADKIAEIESWGMANLSVRVIDGASHTILHDRFDEVVDLIGARILQ